SATLASAGLLRDSGSAVRRATSGVPLPSQAKAGPLASKWSVEQPPCARTPAAARPKRSFRLSFTPLHPLPSPPTHLHPTDRIPSSPGHVGEREEGLFERDHV